MPRDPQLQTAPAPPLPVPDQPHEVGVPRWIPLAAIEASSLSASERHATEQYCRELCGSEAERAASEVQRRFGAVLAGSGSSPSSVEERRQRLYALTRTTAAEHCRPGAEGSRWGVRVTAALTSEREVSCAQTPGLLARRANGDLPAAGAVALEDHARECLRCRELSARASRAEQAFLAPLPATDEADETTPAWVPGPAADPEPIAEPVSEPATTAWLPVSAVDEALVDAAGVAAVAGEQAAPPIHAPTENGAAAVLAPVITGDPAPPEPHMPDQDATPEQRRPRLPLAALAAITALLVGVAAAVVLSGGSSGPAPRGSSAPVSSAAANAVRAPTTRVRARHRRGATRQHHRASHTAAHTGPSTTASTSTQPTSRPVTPAPSAPLTPQPTSPSQPSTTTQVSIQQPGLGATTAPAAPSGTTTTGTGGP